VRLVIVHSHFRPGGVRRVIELATAHLARRLGNNLEEVLLVGGERPDLAWSHHFRGLLGAIPLHCQVDGALGYFSEQSDPPQTLQRRIRQHLHRVLLDRPKERTVVWAHNLGLARNPIVTDELVALCVQQGFRLVLHHHDWCFDNRWSRWPELRQTGHDNRNRTARVLFPLDPNIHHVAINGADAAVLRRHLGRRASWLPNPAETGPPPSPDLTRSTRHWLRSELQVEGPIWLMPCRLLRRKNVAEALLLLRWLRPEACLVTTGSPSSAEEIPYAKRLAAAAHQEGWPLRLSVLYPREARKPGVAALMESAEVVLLTSLVEGFGLPYLEATLARRPLIARQIPNVAPDLRRFGFRFPQAYDDVLVDPRLLDWEAERHRQSASFHAWRNLLPAFARARVQVPAICRPDSAPNPLAFSRLSLVAQLEVLRQPVDRSWRLCAPLNPFLRTWRRRAVEGRLQVAHWPAKAERWLGGPAYAQHLWHIFQNDDRAPGRPGVAARLLDAFLRRKLEADNLYPLLWNPEA
jgi:glycosyltransferase involved in cell wall biosynthesis